MDEIKTYDKNGIWAFILELIRLIFISLIIILPIRLYIAQPFFVKGGSMEPNFFDGDYLIIDEISYRFKEPERFDVIVFHSPFNPKQFFIKRIIGLPGETIEIKNDKIKIYNESNPSGFFLDESGYLAKNQLNIGNLKISLKDKEYFVLGDNRLQSSDSRYWGPLYRSYIVGRAFLRAWPLNRLDKF